MATITDHTIVSAPIAPTDDRDSYASHRAKWGHGGYRTVDQRPQLEHIPYDRREIGMLAFVIEDWTTWRLLEDLVSWENVSGSGCCALLEWAIQDLDNTSICDLDGIFCLEPGEEDYPFVYRHGDTMTGDLNVPDEAYGPAWNGSMEVPTKNALYFKIETLGGGGTGGTFNPIIHRQFTPVKYLLLPHPIGREPTVQVMDSRGAIMLAQVIPTPTTVEFSFEITTSFVAILT